MSLISQSTGWSLPGFSYRYRTITFTQRKQETDITGETIAEKDDTFFFFQPGHASVIRKEGVAVGKKNGNRFQLHACWIVIP